MGLASAAANSARMPPSCFLLSILTSPPSCRSSPYSCPFRFGRLYFIFWGRFLFSILHSVFSVGLCRKHHTDLFRFSSPLFRLSAIIGRSNQRDRTDQADDKEALWRRLLYQVFPSEFVLPCPRPPSCLGFLLVLVFASSFVPAPACWSRSLPIRIRSRIYIYPARSLFPCGGGRNRTPMGCTVRGFFFLCFPRSLGHSF